MYDKNEYIRNREKRLATMREKYRKDGGNKKRRYYLENYNEIARKKRERYVKDRDTIIAIEKLRYRSQVEEIRSTRSKVGKDRRSIARQIVLDHYGRICVCCGETNEKFLTIDHINGNGNKHRKTITGHMPEWLVKNDFPDGFQLLCYNCNCGKRVNGGVCPHTSNGV